ncbi:MAG: CHASE3 domain-containing protein, partial [Conexibacter sp.]
MSRRSASRWVTLAAATLALATTIGAGLGIYAIVRLTDARHIVVERNGPSALAVLRLTNALLNQETGVRGYALSRAERALAPYREGRVEAAAAAAELARRIGDSLPLVRADLARVER